MRRSTIIGCFVSLLSLTMTAQVANPSTSKTDPGTEVVKKSPSLQELLKRYAEIGNKSGSIFESFTKEEQRVLRSHFDNQKPEKSTQVLKAGNGKSSVLPMSAAKTVSPTPVVKGVGANKQYTPLFMAPEVEVDLAPKATQFIYENPFIYGSRNSGFERPQPTASLEELLARIQNAENQSGIDTQVFTPAEQQVLREYFTVQNSANRGPNAVLLEENFDDITTMPGDGFSFVNASDILGLTDWFQGNETVFPSQSGGPTSYIGANYNNTAGSVINNFMITPVLNLENGDEITFWTRTTTGSTFPDRLEVRLDPTGANTNPSGPSSVGSYTELLLEINPGLTIGGYPDIWTQFTVTVSGLAAATDTRVAFRYWVTNAGPVGSNSDYIGIDSLSIEEGAGGGGGGDSVVYGLNIRGGSCATDFGTFPLAGPYNIVPISNTTTSIYGGDFDGSGTLYAFDGTLSTLLTLDITTGAETTIAPITGLLPTETLRGIAWNEANSTMYLMAGIGEVGSIYTVDLATAVATLVGSTTITGWLPIWLAIDSNGNAFMADIGLDSLYSVSLTTGTATLVGPLGININFAQDADFDPDTNILYMGAYVGAGVNFFASVDTTTGAATALGSVNTDCAEMGLISLKGTGGGGGGGTACSQADASNSFENGYGNINNTVEVADEIIVAAGTNFEVNQLTVNLINNGGFNSVDVAFYEDAGGMPGTMIGSIMTIVPTSSTAIGTAFGRDVLSIVLDIAPTVILNGNANSETVYWIGVETPNPVDPVSDAYWETTSIPNAGTDYRVHYDVANTGWISTLAADDMWNTVYTVSGNCEPTGGGGAILDTAYGINNGNFELIGFPVSDPSTVEVFGDSPVTSNFENAGAIDPANPRTGYVIDNGGQFYSFDVESGFYTLLGNIPGDWIGMEFDQATGVLYAIAGASLYTIDPVAITATLVGATGINPADLPIALAIDGAGVGYTYELVTDNLYSIDLSTGTATLIGNIGFDANFGQGMCYDALTDTIYMAAFNNATFAAEWRSVNKTTGATTLVGPIVTTATTTQVAWVSIGETLPPPACPEPTNLVVSNITATTADLSWSAEPNATNGYIWYVFDQGANPVTDTPVATGTTPAGTTTATATGLGGGFNYDFYVVADCTANGLSQYAGPITFATPPACGGKFYDTGGPAGNYENNANVTTVITPENSGEQVTVTFTAFDVETAWDALYVYDGPDTSSPLISSGNPQTNGGFPAGGYYGNTIPGPFVSSHATGALTFVFLSDGSVPYPGWEADVTCALLPPPNDMIVNSIDVDEIGFPYTDPAVRMPAATTEDGNPVNCDLTGANGVWYNFVSAGDGTAIASISTPGGASSVTFYTAPDENAVETDLVLVPQNSNQCAPGTSASIFTLAGQAYYVFVLNNGAITDIVIDGTNLGTADNTIVGFSYYPNPTTGIINLSSVENIEQVSIYSLLGQKVMDTRVDATTSNVDISALSAGTYLMKVIVNGQTGTYRVLKN